MKKLLCLFLMFLLLLPTVPINASDEIVLYIGSYRALINNEVVDIDKNPLIVPIIKNDYTFVPVRFVAEAFKMKVDFDADTKTVSLSGGKAVSFQVGSGKMTVGGVVTQNENTSSFILNDRTFLPIRAISEALGKQVSYDKGLIVISDTSAEKDKDTKDQMISKLNSLLVVGTKDNLKNLLGSENRYYSKSGGIADGVPMPAPTVAESVASDSAKSSDYSKTNVQVDGVDEADIVKTDGNYIYQAKDNKIIITKINPASDMSVIGTIENDGTPIEMYVDADKLVVISNVSDNKPAVYDSAVPAQKRIMPMYYKSYTRCTVFDISDRSNPKTLRTFEIEGNLISSRKINNIFYMVTNKYAYFSETEPVAPLLKDNSENYSEIPLTNVYYFPNFKDQTFMTVSSLDINKPEKEANVNTILGAGQNIYVSLDNMYIATNNYLDTTIYKFSLNEGLVTFIAKENVPGYIINQFSMDEYEGNFRIATTNYENNQQMNNLYILDASMKKRGSITGIAPGENIYSTRFLGNRGYMVTFKLVDPLFVLDLSDIDNPKILGKLKIPGYSNYLHPVDENHIIGFGKDTQENKSGAFYQGMKMALFDITDVSNPKEEYVEIIGGRGTDSTLLYNHKALLYDAEKRLLAFPVTVYSENDGVTNYGNFEFSGAYVYDFSASTGFKLAGKISHLNSDDYLKSGSSYDYNKSIDRILYANGNLFTTSRSFIQAHTLDKVSFIKSIELK